MEHLTMRGMLFPVLAALLPLAAPAQQAPDTAAVSAVMKEGQSAVQEANFTAAIESFKKATEMDPKNGRAWQMLGYSLHAANRLDEALPIHLKAAEFKQVAPVATYNVACVYSLKGDKDKAMQWLEKAVSLGFNDKDQVVNDTDFAGMKDDPRFQKLVSGLGTAVQPFVVTTDRRSARVAYFGGGGSPGQLAIDYGAVDWNDKFDSVIDSPKSVGKRWRFGSDFWTTLDTSLPLRIAGVEIPPGIYYLTVRNDGDHKFVLGVHDPVAVKKQHIDAFRAELVQGGIDAPLTYARADSVQKKLDVAITLPDGEKTKGTLRVRFGGHTLTADVEIGLSK
jgi:hypothetical protein